ncbi:hypothetical protein EDB85DRAFT_1299293 [Lactarius pseudohatsudake]|nr:hypothetical protein EDB85DRAFT_1299293 [Lactarius pseudohatsudake]
MRPSSLGRPLRLRPRAEYRVFRTDDGPTLAHIARSHSWTVDRQAEQRTAIVDHGNPGACQDTSATAPPCANDGVLGELLATLDADEFGPLTGLVDDVSRIASKSGADCLADTENAEDQNLTGVAKTETRDTAAPLQRQHPVRSRDEAECLPDSATRGALTAHGVALLGASDPRPMSALAARRAWYQASHNQRHGN